MAKLTGPLMSLAASGQLGKTLVFGDWKGIKYARQYIIPANPNSAGQQSIRGFLADAVAAWLSTTAQLNAKDKANLNTEAAGQGKPLSGFNLFVRNYVRTKVAGGTILGLHDTIASFVAPGTFKAIATSVANTVDVEMAYGTSKTALVNKVTRTEGAAAGTTHTFDVGGLSAGVVYYYKIYGKDALNSETLGIGSNVGI